MTTAANVRCLSFEELVREAADLSDFEQRLARDSGMAALDELYVQPSYQVEVGLNDPGASLDEYVRKWLSRPAGGLLWLLGDFGTGKTWFSRHFAHNLAKRKVDDGLGAMPTPVLVPLRQFTRTDDMLGAVQKVLVEGGARLAAGRATVDWLVRHGRLVPIFDGADEHPQVIAEAQRLTSWGCHLVVTCRTHYFDTVAQAFRALGVAQGRQKPVDWITHLGFNEQALAEAIRRRCGDNWKEKQDALTRRPDLWEMVHRPLFLDMVLRTLAEPPAGRTQTVADVYDGHVSQVLRTRWSRHRHGKVVTSLLRKALERLSYMGLEKGTLAFSRGTILRVASEMLQNARAGLTAEEIQQAICTGSLMVRNPDDEYEFGHRSFQEYLAACDLRRRRTAGARLVCDHVADRNWHEVCWLYASLCESAEPVLSACLERRSPDEPQPLFLAARAMEAARDFGARRAPELGDALIKLFEKEGLAYRDLQRIYESIRRMGEAGRATLHRHIRGKDARIRRRCVLTWFESFGHEAFSRVLPYIDGRKEKNRHVRWHVAEVLAEVSDRVDATAVAKFLLHSKDRDVIICGNALWARARHSRPRGVPQPTRRAIERVVAEIAPLVAGEFHKVAGKLKPWIANEEGRHHPRAHGALLLGRCVSVLGWEQRERESLGRMLCGLLETKSDWRGYVARALGELGWIGAVPGLCGYLATSRDEEIWLRYAVDALDQLTQPRSDHVEAIEKAKEQVPEKFSELRSRLEVLAANLRGPALSTEPSGGSGMNQHDGPAASSPDVRVLADALQELIAYLAVRDIPRPADVIVGLGSDCRDVAERVAELFSMGLAPRIVFAGGRGRLTGTLAGTEAGFLNGIAVQLGVPSELIILEEESTNTLENIRFSAAMLRRHGIAPRQVILVTQPVLQRRAWATARRQWPGVEFLNCPPDTRAHMDVTTASGVAKLRDLAAGEIERLRRYAARGDIEPQCVPANVHRAYQATVGFKSSPKIGQ